MVRKNKSIERKRVGLSTLIPEKRPVEQMIDYVDVLLYSSMKKIDGILKNAEATPKDHILAANTVVNIGKYLFQRQQAQATDRKLIIDDELRIGE